MEWMLLKEGCECWLDMVGSAGEKPRAAGWQREEEGGLHPELLPPAGQRKEEGRGGGGGGRETK